MTIPYDKVENAEAWTAWQCVEQTSINIFLTGNAGTGKTTFLKNLRDKSPKRMVVVAPTGVAAINAGGVTIHSFFQLPFGPFIPGTHPKFEKNVRREKIRIMRTLDLLVIDEISMVRADLLDGIDAILRFYRHNDNPFGGVQLLMIGDLQQLSPVVVDNERDIISQYYATPYFFSSLALRRTAFATIELKRIYRQSDRIFVELLNQIRNNQTNNQTLNAINSRYIPNFDPSDEEGYIRLTTHNNLADNLNNKKLMMIESEAKNYECHVEGTFPESSFPAEKSLLLKVGAQVMFIKNDSSLEKRYYNGKIARVTALDKDIVAVRTPDGDMIEVSYEKWENTKYSIDKSTNEIVEEIEGTFMQIPLRLAWAITIHKSQGLTFDKAIIDAQMSFAHGQVYVALSRCRSLQGLVLSSQINPISIKNDYTVIDFIEQQSTNGMTEQRMETSKSEYFVALITELFNFRDITVPCCRLERLLEENCRLTYPQALATVKILTKTLDEKVLNVASRFVSLSGTKSTVSDLRTDNEFAERIRKGAQYFIEQLSTAHAVNVQTNLVIDNKVVAKQFDENREQLSNELYIKLAELKVIAEKGFSTQTYLQARADAILKLDKNNLEDQQRKKSSEIKVPEDARFKDLFTRLIKWRRQRADEDDCLEFMVVSTKAFVDISNYLPTTLAELGTMSGMGTIKISRYGDDILNIVLDYINEYNIDITSLVKKGDHKKKAKPKKEKTEKVNTRQISYDLFMQYKDLKKVADERNLKEETILGHLLDMANEGRLTYIDIMGEERYNNLCNMVKSNSHLSLSEMGSQFLRHGFYYKETAAIVRMFFPEKVSK